MTRGPLLLLRAVVVACALAVLLAAGGCSGRDKRLLGTWQLEGNRNSVMGFDKDGKVHLMGAPFISVPGPTAHVKLDWRTSGETLIILIGGTKDKVEFTYELSGDELILTESSGDILRYHRLE